MQNLNQKQQKNLNHIKENLKSQESRQYDDKNAKTSIKRGDLKIREVQESEIRGVLDYEELSSYSKYNIGQDKTQNQGQVYEKYVKALNKRVICKLERKSVAASLNAEKRQKNQMEEQLTLLERNKVDRKQKSKQKLRIELQNLKSEILLQEELKKSLQDQQETLQILLNLSKQNVQYFPQESMSNCCELMTSESDSIKIQGQKISCQLALENVLLSNLEQIIDQLPSI